MKLSALQQWLQPSTLVLLRFAGWMMVVAIAVLSLVPGSLRPHVTSVDKVEHFVAYLAVGMVFTLGYQGRIAPILIAVSFTIGAAALEIGQLLVPDRGSSIADFAWSSVGVWCGVALAWPIRRLVHQLRWPTSLPYR